MDTNSNKMPPSVQTIFNHVYTQEIYFPPASLSFPCSRAMRETIPYTDFLANHVDPDLTPCSEVPDQESRLTVSVCLDSVTEGRFVFACWVKSMIIWENILPFFYIVALNLHLTMYFVHIIIFSVIYFMILYILPFHLWCNDHEVNHWVSRDSALSNTVVMWPFNVDLCWDFTAQSTQWGRAKHGQFT